MAQRTEPGDPPLIESDHLSGLDEGERTHPRSRSFVPTNGVKRKATNRMTGFGGSSALNLELEALRRTLEDREARRDSAKARHSLLRDGVQLLLDELAANEEARAQASQRLAEVHSALGSTSDLNASRIAIDALTALEAAERDLGRGNDRLAEARATLLSLEREIDSIDIEISRLRIEIGDRMDPSKRIIALSRDMGLERGVDVSLRVLFVRWWTLFEPGRYGQWARVASSIHPARELRELFLEIFPPEFSHVDLDQYGEALDRLVEVVDGVQAATPTSTQELLASTFESTLSRSLGISRDSGAWETPVNIANLLARLTCRADSAVLDPACGVGSSLIAAARIFPGCTLTGIELNAEVAARAWMRLRIAGYDADIEPGEAFSQPGYGGSSDAVMIQPPWGLRPTEAQAASIRTIIETAEAPEIFRARDFPWLLLAYNALRPGGCAAVILPTQSLWDIHRKVHQYLIAKNAVEAIITLPEGGIFPHTRIGTVIWILRNQPHGGQVDSEILMIDAESIVANPDSPIPALNSEGVERILGIVQKWRQTREISVQAHVAVSVQPSNPELIRGIDPHRFLGEPPADLVHSPEPPNRLLTSILVENFKSFASRTTIPLAPLTIIFGANSAGKSTVIQTLMLLKQSVDQQQLITQGLDTDVGGFDGIIHYQQAPPLMASTESAPPLLGLGIEYGALNSWIPPNGAPDPSYLRRVEFRFANSSELRGALISESVGFGPYAVRLRPDRDVGVLRVDLETAADLFDGLATQRLLFPATPDRGLALGATALRGQSRARMTLMQLERQRRSSAEEVDVPLEWNGLLAGKTISLPRRTTAGMSNTEERILASYLGALGHLIDGIGHEVRELLRSIIYLGPLRSAPQRFYNRASASVHPGDAHHIAMYLFDHSNVVNSVNDWLQTLEVPYSLDVVPVTARGAGALVGDLVALSLTDNRSGAVVTPADVGFGISQMLPIVVELLAHRESIICIEQPETHLHPRLQTRLADLLLESCRNGDLANQLIVETHSEHLMLRLQRRIREGAVDPEDISVLYVDQTADGCSTVTRLRLDHEGEFLDEWPEGFFDERLDELFGTP